MNLAQAVTTRTSNFAQCIDPAWVQAGCPAPQRRAPAELEKAEQPRVVVHERREAPLPTAPVVRNGNTARILVTLLDEARPWRFATDIARAIECPTQSNVSALLAQMRDRHGLLRCRGSRRRYEFALTAKGRARAQEAAAKAAAAAA